MQAANELLEQGFTIITRVFDEHTLEHVRALADRLVCYADKAPAEPFEGYYLRHRPDQGVLYDLFQRHPEFQALARSPTVLDVLEQVIGKDIFPYENSLVYEPQGRPNSVPRTRISYRARTSQKSLLSGSRLTT